MFTKEQLAKWREQGFDFDDPFYDDVAVEKEYDSESLINSDIILDSNNLVSIENTYFPNIGVNSTSNKKTISQLISYLKEAEDKLILAKYDLFDRIHIIRGIFYGTPWSVDYIVEKSNVRNVMFQAYTGSTMPVDPRGIIGQDLYMKLFNCAEVYENKNKALDFGHLIIGMDARRNRIARNSSYPGHGGGTGLEICTWLGDLGGAAGMLSINRVTSPKTRAIGKFKGSSYGGYVNLEGDIASYLIAANSEDFDSVSSISLEDDDYIYEALKKYALSNSGWNNRARNFLQILGAEFKEKSNEIENIDSLKKIISSKIESFGDLYMFNRLRQSGKINFNTLVSASSHLNGASKEITDIFIHTLQTVISSPNKLLQASGIDPNPSPAGEPKTKYVNMKKTTRGIEKYAKELEDWIRKL